LNRAGDGLAWLMQSDQDLIKLANFGNEEAMTELYERHRDFCANLAFKYLNDKSEAEDVLQETFAYLFSKFPGFVLTCQLQTFLFPVVRNKCLSYLRKKKPHTDPEVLDNRESKPFRDMDSDRQRVLDMIVGLPEQHRDVILLRFADQMTLEEIAEKLQVPKGTVKSRLHNGLKKLRDNPSFIWIISLLELTDF
jgi:RNA polymerase sigma-70 factor (ECF subfamily)